MIDLLINIIFIALSVNVFDKLSNKKKKNASSELSDCFVCLLSL